MYDNMSMTSQRRGRFISRVIAKSISTRNARRESFVSPPGSKNMESDRPFRGIVTAQKLRFRPRLNPRRDLKGKL